MQDWKSLLEDLRGLLKGNLWIVWVVVGCVALAIALLTGLSALGSSRPKDPSGSAATTTAAESDDTSDIDTSDDQAAKPSDEQQRAIDAYTSEERDVIATMKSTPWFTPQNKKVTFGDTSYTLDGTAPRPYAITAVKVGQESSQTVRDNVEITVKTQETTFSVIDETGRTTICTLTTMTDQNGTTRSITGSAFADGATIAAYAAASKIDFQLPGELAGALKNNKDGLNAELRKWASANAPAASKATWDNRATYDYRTNEIIFDLTLNDTVSTKLKVTYSVDKNSFKVEKESD